jgi:molybdopterin synthase catalytic subunit
MATTTAVRIQREDFELERELAAIRGQVGDAGAIVTFTGLCRSEGGRLAALEIEHYPGMAEIEVTRTVQEAVRRWPLLAATVIHRHGRITAGENIVLVIVASSHRQAAFAAAEFLMDWLKSFAPFWKREHHADGTVGEWVEAKAADELAASSWDCTPGSSQQRPHPTGLLIVAPDELTSHQNKENRREDHELGVG